MLFWTMFACTVSGALVYGLNMILGCCLCMLKQWCVDGTFIFYNSGDDGSSEEPQQGVLVKESESLYTLWCTGRAGCDGMLVEIKV